MSKAFVKESEDGGDASEDLPDRSISEHANLVTKKGLAMIEARLAALHADHAAAHDRKDKPALGATNRELRYWTSRRATAQLMPPPEKKADTVQFGATVTIERDDGRKQKWLIVGEDEAEPTKGSLSYTSPVARALMGKSVGDVVSAGPGKVTIVAIA